MLVVLQSHAQVVERAAALRQRALDQCARSRFDLAEHTLLKALELVAAPARTLSRQALSTRVRVLMTLSNVEKELHGRDGGDARLKEAEALADVSGDASLAFAVDSAMALQALRQGAYEEALEHFEQAERNVRHASRSEACILYLNRGNLMLQRLQLGQARRDLNRCIGLASAEPATEQHRSWEFMARHNLGYLEFLAGNLPRALAVMDEAAAMPTGASHAISALDKARVLLEAGLSDAADSVLRGAELEFRRGRLHRELAETELARAECAVLASDLKAARALAASARTRFRRRGDHRWRRVAELTLLSADLADGRPPTLLIAPAVRLAGEFAAEGLHLQARTAELIACSALSSAGQLRPAQERFGGLPPIGRTDPIAIRLHQRAVGAGLLSAAGQAASARGQVRAGLAELSRHQAQFGSIDLQTASAIHGRDLVQLDLDLALADGSAAAVFDAIERGRAVSRRLTAVTPPAGESAGLLAELRQLTEIIKAIGDDPSARAQVSAMRERTTALYGQLSSLAWRSIGDGGVLHPARMRDVAAAAAAQHKVFVSYCQVRGRWSAVVLGDGRPRWVPLPGDDTTLELSRRAQADLDVLAYGSLPPAMRRAVETTLRSSLHRLDEALVTPLRLKDSALAIVPTGPTTTLPWSCLPSLRGRPVEVAPTGTSWLSGTQAGEVVRDVVVEVFSGPGLATATAEAAEVGGLWGPRLALGGTNTGAAATRARLSAALASASLVHVAAHGSHMRQNPMFSSLELADGPLFAYEIADRTVAAHVVLSACELGQATTRPGDEALGLARVLLQLGSQCVVAAVAQVADELAGQVMADYHRRLVAGDDSATALAGATESGPYVPFMCFGSSWRAG